MATVDYDPVTGLERRRGILGDAEEERGAVPV
jgi:hypothetical protein